jgi:NAD-dependent SIR2 family protein deacetylase
MLQLQVLAALGRKGLAQYWLQQNHDRLAQKAGWPQERLNEIHGAWGDDKNSGLQSCYSHKQPSHYITIHHNTSGSVNLFIVVMMGGQLRADLLSWMMEWTAEADLCIAMGTSLCGMTSDVVADQTALRHSAGRGLGLVIINLQATAYDDRASLRIWGLLDDVLLLLANELRVKVPDKECRQIGATWEARHPKCRYQTPIRR